MKIEINFEYIYSPPIKYIKLSTFKGCFLINQMKANFQIEIIEESAFESYFSFLKIFHPKRWVVEGSNIESNY